MSNHLFVELEAIFVFPDELSAKTNIPLRQPKKSHPRFSPDFSTPDGEIVPDDKRIADLLAEQYCSVYTFAIPSITGRSP